MPFARTGSGSSSERWSSARSIDFLGRTGTSGVMQMMEAEQLHRLMDDPATALVLGIGKQCPFWGGPLCTMALAVQLSKESDWRSRSLLSWGPHTAEEVHHARAADK